MHGIARQRWVLVLFGLLLPFSAFAQSVTISPRYVSIGVGATVQYTAQSNGNKDAAITWQVQGIPGGNAQVGTISSTGLYTAPRQIPAQNVLITAIGANHASQDAVYVNIAPPGPSITAINPAAPLTGQFTAVLSGSGFVPGAIVTEDGVALTSKLLSSTQMQIVGYRASIGLSYFSVQNPATLAGAPFGVTFKSSTPQTIAPTSLTLATSASTQFTAPGATACTASLGSVTAAGLYTAPASIPPVPVAVTCTSANGAATALVTIVKPQAISPNVASLPLGTSVQFQSAGATAWTTSAGTVSASGLFTAPSALPAGQSAVVTATGPGGSASATVSLIAPTPVVTGLSTAQIPLGAFAATLSGTGFLPGATVQLGAQPLSVSYAGGSLAISGFAAHAGPSTLTVSNGTFASAPYAVQVGVANAKVSSAAARRFLEQAAFGPTPADADHVQTLGFAAWIAEQQKMAQISNYNSISTSQNGMPAHFMTNAVMNADQLRQRVAFALSQIFVTSIQKLIWNDNMVPFQNMLLADSFVNYRQIMEDVTLSPAMGQYLDMANNAKADASLGSVANENYARELMQLFTLGTTLLNNDSTAQVDKNGQPIPTYSQFTITEFARVFTGWTYVPRPGGPVVWNAFPTVGPTMLAYPAEHDGGSKTLLNGAVLPAGLTPQADLEAALDNIFKHPNAGPFVGRLLIQHLVKSNPSPAYVARVAAAFNDNGSGVRGDMKAVVAAILLDPEARANDEGGKDQATDGHLQEPALFLAGVVRAFHGQMTDQNYWPSVLAGEGQDIFNSPSVFNYYSPTFGVSPANITGGEFQIYTPNNAILRANSVASLFSNYDQPVMTSGPGTTVDLTPFVAAAQSPSLLVDALDLALTHGTMPAAMKAQILNAVNADSLGPLHQVQTAAYLILTSSYYNVWH